MQIIKQELQFEKSLKQRLDFICEFAIEFPRQDLTFKQLKIYYEGQGSTIANNFERNLELKEAKHFALVILL